MLILTKRKDYYDGIVGTMGIDKTIVYDRKETEFVEGEMPKMFRGTNQMFHSRNNPFSGLGYYSINKENADKYQAISFFIIGFCGKLYVGWKLYSIIDDKKDNYPKSSYVITYDLEFVKTLVAKKSWYNTTNIEDEVKTVQSIDAMELFRELKSPAFVYDVILDLSFSGRNYSRSSIRFIVNPILADYGFFKVFDSFQAFQEIQMFLGGVLGVGEKPIVVVADKYKIAQHGFDKFSFRKDKEIK